MSEEMKIPGLQDIGLLVVKFDTLGSPFFFINFMIIGKC